MYIWKIFSPILWAPPKSGDHFLFSINYFEFFCQNRLAFSFCTILLLCWVYIVTFTKVPITYHVKFIPFIILLYSPSPMPGIVSKGLNFPFTCMCIQYLHHIHTPTHPFPTSYVLPFPPGSNPPERTCSALLFPVSVKKKNDSFVCLR
jgi:hypothetical protein